MNLEIQLEELEVKKRKILKKIEKRNQQKTIKCAACDKLHSIGSLDAIQMHWYTEPYGCTGGDYWNTGELRFVCPLTNIVNRLLFNNYDVPWENRHEYEYDAEEQFRNNYKYLFKSVKDTYRDKENRKTVNNYYVDKHRKKFGLVEKSS